jgi:hypothetical protein
MREREREGESLNSMMLNVWYWLSMHASVCFAEIVFEERDGGPE